MTNNKLNHSNRLKTELDINYDQEYDEMSLDLMLDYLKFEKRSQRYQKIIDLLIKFGGWVVALIIYVYYKLF